MNGERPRQWSRIRGFGLGNSGSESRYENAGGQHGQRHRTGIATLALNLISFLSLSLSRSGSLWGRLIFGVDRIEVGLGFGRGCLNFLWIFCWFFQFFW